MIVSRKKQQKNNKKDKNKKVSMAKMQQISTQKELSTFFQCLSQ